MSCTAELQLQSKGQQQNPKHISMKKHRLKLMKILLLVYYYMFVLPEVFMVFNSITCDGTVLPEKIARIKSQYCSDPLGSDHLRQAEKVQFEPAA